MIGIIGAMEEEVSKLKDMMTGVQVQEAAGMSFVQGKLEGKEIVVVRSGIGKVNAALCSQILVNLYGVSAIINTGIAGSLKAEINIGDIVLSSDALQHDVDATTFGYAPGQIPRVDTFSFPADEGLIKLAEKCCREVNPEIGTWVGRVVSGDQFISDKEKKNWIHSTFDGYCTEMEGAAIAQAAYLNKVPYLVIRAISDKADDSASIDYPIFEAAAIEHSVRLVAAMIKEMNEL
ncbi:5'-methylthioadenosine/adenosylhomocysteine nucleosidase [Clostridium sp. chh4-2]|uniref:5'-methylthioadenosine/adenosylhomocysteine nucleosidase n=1 Tax=Clostridium sp. chh4-2 TaxID=2067550 RepID=UPI000CCEED82|nr:5'-methylthioadenosine/adenosylhomocysteine nucleosidase [Clostridium sp. chh4-2]PNV60830.1 5'-methylthioadenosine/adenosylhomocysteine nucleosidase [Clostridium sp. chh4-2]